MITPAQIREKALKIWQSGRLLSAHLAAEELFPLDIPFRKITPREALERFAEVRESVGRLREGSRERLGYGYTVEFATVNHRQLGPQPLPSRIRFDTPADLLRFTGKQREFDLFRTLVAATLTEEPGLHSWLLRNPLKVLENRDVWHRLLLVCRFFRQWPRPGRYLRELDIPGVDSKFIEQKKRILRELLDRVLPPEAIDQEVTAMGESGFERRYGLRFDEKGIRFRLLDPRQTPAWGATDLSVPLGQFQHLDPPVRRVFITENKINGLSFPPVPESLVIFGLGYGIQSFKEATWLRDREIFYWGDLDTHGFAILSQLRGYFPQARSFLMDRGTLMEFRPLWGAEEPEKRCLSELPNLTPQEAELFRDLRDNRLGENVRLEQERIAFARLGRELERLPGI